MSSMVAFISSPIDTLLQPATRARAPSRTCTAVPSQPFKSNPRCDLRETNLTSNTRWGSRSRDPIGYEGSPYDLFEYCEANPERYEDPFGLMTLQECKAICDTGAAACYAASATACLAEYALALNRCRILRLIPGGHHVCHQLLHAVAHSCVTYNLACLTLTLACNKGCEKDGNPAPIRPIFKQPPPITPKPHSPLPKVKPGLPIEIEIPIPPEGLR